MMIPPLRFKQFSPRSDLLFANEAGMFFASDDEFLERYVRGKLTDADRSFLQDGGMAFDREGDLDYAAHMFRWANRFARPGGMDYVILVPTLRCNLACGYCQVSRVNENTPGFDWSEDILESALSFLGGLKTQRIKIEFQGGEPLLRLDILETVRDFCRERFEASEFVVCTNLQRVEPNAWQFLASPDTYVSTSLDGDLDTHSRQRTKSNDLTAAFETNLERAVSEFPGRVSALPTLDVMRLPDPVSIIETFGRFGLRSIFLRPVNHQGFARKRYSAVDVTKAWNEFHSSFIDAAIEHNWRSELPIEEYYFTHCLRRIMRPGQDSHTDLRNPALLGKSFVVIDHDGTFYPTDEARMQTRIGAVDLSCGHVKDGIVHDRLEQLNSSSINNFDPDCMHCPYQPYCGIDVIDDISRYGRIDVPKHDTDFCRRHMHLFDKAFELLYSDDPKVKKSLGIWLGTHRYEQSIARSHI
jgi:His-Xaa-Ser system radical SAM maturase HxsB